MNYHIEARGAAVNYTIDVSSVLRRTVCDLYSNLVTRSTGATVRKAIEEALAGVPEPNVTVIDFSHVTLLDFSCADEVVGKLLDAYHRTNGRPGTYFQIRGVHPAHLEAIEAVLERYDLAVIVQDDTGSVQLCGTIDDGVRRVWHLVRQHGVVRVQHLVDELGESHESGARALDELLARRLVVRRDDGFVALPQAS